MLVCCILQSIEETYGYIKIAIEIQRVIKIFVDWRDKTNTVQDRTVKFCTFSYKAISHITTRYLISCGNKDTDHLIVHVLSTQRNLRLRLGTFKYFENCKTISSFIYIKRKSIHITTLKCFHKCKFSRNINDFSWIFP